MLSLWADAARFGERYLAMLQEYVEVFFAEEERRLRPYLEAALAQAQAAYNEREWPDFLAEILGGMPVDGFPETVTEIVFAPSYWVTPYAFRLQATETRMIITFRARPPGASLIPGEVVPDMLLAALKALADGTRLRILQQLTASPATPTQLARRLRLRPATIGHHIKQLQLAGLVRVNAREGKEVWYASRHADVELLFANTIKFLTQET
jgi:DNA-binding transcriptional ArsR family regulator